MNGLAASPQQSAGLLCIIASVFLREPMQVLFRNQPPSVHVIGTFAGVAARRECVDSGSHHLLLFHMYRDLIGHLDNTMMGISLWEKENDTANA